jgi:integrase
MPAMPSRVDRHPANGMLRYRRAVPEALRPLIRKREIVQSLGVRVATPQTRILVAKIDAQTEALFTRMRALLAQAQGEVAEQTDDEAGAEIAESIATDHLEDADRERHPIKRAALRARGEELLREAKRLRGEPVVTLSELVDVWKRRRKLVGKNETVKRERERRVIAARFESMHPGITLDQVTRNHVRKFRDKMLEDKEPSTVKQSLVIMNSLWAAAVEEGLVSDENASPFLSVKVEGSSWSGEKRKPIPRDKFRAIVEKLASAEDKVRIPCLLAMYAGLRRGEAMALQWGDVEDHGEFLAARVERSLDREQPKTVAGRRVVPLPAPLVDLLPELREAKHKPKDDRIAPTYHSANISKAFGVILDEVGVTSPAKKGDGWSGVDDVSLHSTRHLYRDLLVEAGATPDVIDRAIGHAPQGMAKYGSRTLPAATLWEYVKRIKWPGV